LAIILLLFGGAVYYLMASHLLERLDRELATELNGIDEELEESSTTAGEPVLVSVAAIFAPMCPDFPTPSTTTFPRASTVSRISSTAREKFSPNRSRNRLSSKISISRTRLAFSR